MCQYAGISRIGSLMCFRMKLLNFRKCLNCQSFVYLSAWLQQSTYRLNHWTYGIHFFQDHSLFLFTLIFLSFVLLTFVSSKSTFLCSQINVRLPVVTRTYSYAQIIMLGTWYLFYVGLGLRKSAICKIHLLMCVQIIIEVLY